MKTSATSFRWLLLVCAALAVALLVVRPWRSAPQKAAALQDAFILSQTEVNSFDPLDAFHEGHIQIVAQVFDTLTKVGRDGGIRPGLAKSWASEDGKIWRFSLREDTAFAPWNNGTNAKPAARVSASDVVYSFERLLGPASKSVGRAYFAGIEGVADFSTGKTERLSGVSAPDAATVEFKLSEQNQLFPSLVSLPFASVVSKQAAQELGDAFKLKPVGSGAYTVEAFQPGRLIRLGLRADAKAAFPSAPSAVHVHLHSDSSSAYARIGSGTTDFLMLDFPSQQRWQGTSVAGWSQETAPSPKLYFYLFNLEKLPDSAVRRALAQAARSDELIKTIGASGNIAKSVFPSSLFPDLSKAAPLNASEQKSPALAMPAKLRLVCFDDPLSKAVAQVCAKNWEALGCSVEMQPSSFPVLVERLGKGEYDLVQIYWGPLYADPVHFLSPFTTAQAPPRGNNFNRYSNAEFDALVAGAARQKTTEARFANLVKAANILDNDAPIVPLYFENWVRVSSGRYNLPMHPLGYRYYSDARQK